MKISTAMVLTGAAFGLAVMIKCTPDVIASECALAIMAATVCMIFDR